METREIYFVMEYFKKITITQSDKNSKTNTNHSTDERDLECRSSYTIGYKYTI